MSNVVQLKFKGPVPSDETRAAIEDGLFRLAARYGAHEVITIAAAVVAEALEAAHATGRPGNVLWVADLRARLERALKKSD
jgi:hypothetical protein